jgi:SAM-dependent methyltransferase
MKALDASGPNAEQITYWNEQSGAKWVDMGPWLDDQISPLGLATMEHARLAQGERVLDVGCGCGQTSLQLAERVGPGGEVVGVDISTVMLERARARAAEAGVANVRFENADAQTFAFEPERFDLVFSRFGVMFFADPTRAFENLLTALAPGGRLAFLCWQEVGRNPWMLVPLMAAAQHVGMPERPPPGAPGPFAFADSGHVRGILETAGFADVAFESLERELQVGGGGSLEDTVRFALQLGPTGRLLADADEATRTTVAKSVHEALIPYAKDDGVRMDSAAWIATARRPGV